MMYFPFLESILPCYVELHEGVETRGYQPDVIVKYSAGYPTLHMVEASSLDEMTVISVATLLDVWEDQQKNRRISLPNCSARMVK